MLTRPRRLVPSVLLLLAACRGGGTRPTPARDFVDERGIDRAAVLLSDWRPTPPQKCQLARYPATLPAPEALIATRDLPVLLTQVGMTTTRGSALLSLRFDSTGQLRRARVIESTLGDEERHALEQVVISAIEPQLPGREWGVRLRIDLDSTPRFRVGRSEHCDAAMIPPTRNAARASFPIGTAAGLPVGAPSGRRYDLRFALALSAEGEVIDARMVAGSFPDAVVIGNILEELRAQRWLPERDDGLPVPTVVQHVEQLQTRIVTTTVVR